MEVNGRINYPIKLSLNEMSDTGEIDVVNSPVHQFVVSYVAKMLASHGAAVFIEAWNNHRIPQKGVPLELMQQRLHVGRLPHVAIPTCSEAVAAYETLGGRLTRPRQYGFDPLSYSAILQQRRSEIFRKRFPSLAIWLTATAICSRTA